MQIKQPITYYSVNNYLFDTFGYKLYKIPINGGFTCPNRDGTLDTRGCIFCSNMGSGDFIQGKNLDINEQIDLGIEYISKKFPVTKNEKRYIAYFQSYTNTYSDIEDLKNKYTKAIENDNVAVLSIATRPDCISDEVIDLLKEMNQKKPVWVELGLQTTKASSIKYIRRCYENEVYKESLIKLYNAGISQIITHIILGLPYETKNDILDTVKYVTSIILENGYNESNFGFKFQLLHVLKGTDLAKDYENNLFETLSLDEYIDILYDCILNIPEKSVVHRITGDGNKKYLIAPLWSTDKKKVLNKIKEIIKSK